MCLSQCLVSRLLNMCETEMRKLIWPDNDGLMAFSWSSISYVRMCENHRQQEQISQIYKSCDAAHAFWGVGWF